MKTEFLCPYCKGYLKPNTKIILAARKSDGTSGLILFSPKLGEYDIIKHPTFEFAEGEHINMLCPLCQATLTDQNVSQNLARILMRDEKGNEFSIYFSEIYGMKCTYKILGSSVEAFGEDADTYRNFWGVTPKY